MKTFMKVINIFIHLAFIVSMTECFAQNKNRFIINGNLSGLKDGTSVYLVQNREEGGSDTILKAEGKNQKFTFEGTIPLEGEVLFIKFDTVKTKYERTIKGYVKIVAEGKSIDVSGSLDDLSLSSVLVKGSKSHDEYLDYYRLQEECLLAVNTALLNGDDDELKKAYTNLLNQKTAWVNKNSNSLILPWVISSIYESDLQKIKIAYERFTPPVKASYFGHWLKKEIEIKVNTLPGSKLPGFVLQTPVNSLLSLSDVISNGKLTFVYFWASWCAPCKAEYPLLKELYTKYQNKGLNIIAFSTDENEDAWRKSLPFESLSWFNVRQSQNDNIARKLYGIRKLPMSFLLDKEGSIIHKNIPAVKLADFISEYLRN